MQIFLSQYSGGDPRRYTLTQQTSTAREIALAFDVLPMLLGLPGDNTYSNYAEANRSFWRQTVIHLVTRTAASLAHWLGPA